MKILLDSHAFIWWDDEIHKLSKPALAACQDPANMLILSLASVWELQIKIRLGKLQFSIPLQQKIAEQQQTNNLQLLAVRLEHIYALEQLPHHHRDPFDRLLIAQALDEELPIMTHDSAFSQYPVTVIW